LARAADPERAIAALSGKTKFAGEIIVAHGNQVIVQHAAGAIDPNRGERHQPGAVWRWGPITRQLAAVIIMQEVAAGRLELDAPVRRYYPFFRSPHAATLTIRQLLHHRSGLPHPDESPRNAQGIAAFYQPDWSFNAAANGWCVGPVRFAPGQRTEENGCDYLVLDAVLQMVSGQGFDQLAPVRFGQKLSMASLGVLPATARLVPGFIANAPEPAMNLAAMGAYGNLVGTEIDLLRFDRALMTGRLLDPATLATLWRSDQPPGGMAAGQWVHQLTPKGCAKPVRVIEARGSAFGVQGRNFILPDLDMVVIAFTNRSEADFAFGDPAQEKTFSHELLRAVACA
jgi:CubicO group peptidase (beta-lactamase class C family)